MPTVSTLALALWDDAEAMLARNEEFAAVLPAVAHMMVPGVSYEVLLQAAVGAGAIASAQDDSCGWLARHLSQQRGGEPGDIVEMLPGRFFRLATAQLANGYRVTGWSDITVEREHEQGHRQSEARYRELLELTPAVALVHDGDRVLFCNSRGAATLGYDSADALQGLLLATVLDQDTQRLRRGDGTLLEGKTSEAPLDDGDRCYTLVIAEITPDREPADNDPLTGLAGRGHFFERLQHFTRQAEASGTMVALLLIDLDHFKTVNDTLGHAVGDRLLQEVATRLRGCLPADGFAARVGGDEFAVIRPGITGAEQVSELAQAIETVLAEPVMSQGQALHTGGSIGITLYPDHAESAEDLLKGADLALYRAKSLGRGCAAFYSRNMGEEAHHHLRLGQGLRRALAQNEFALHYQPKVDLADGMVVGGEALLRWNHPARGLVAPGEFIAHAEATGMILAIGGWALEGTCAQLGDWARKGSLTVPVWVNVSPAQFQDRALIDKVRNTLLGAGVPPRLLGLEITESVLMPNAALAVETLTSLVELGVELSIDDFGTGYSSLNYLKRLPVGKLKIDRSFVTDITRNPIDGAIARAIIHLGHSLGMKVLAEGVETEDQASMLSDLGCDQIQGLLISPPLPADAFVDFVNRRSGQREPHL